MLDIGNYYIFKPPYSESEYFVRVKDVSKSDKDGKQYVYYNHVLNDMEGDCERSHFENGSINLTVEKLKNIIQNVSEEIENLKDKKNGFEELYQEMKSDVNFNENGKSKKSRQKKEQNQQEVVEKDGKQEQPKRKKAVRR